MYLFLSVKFPDTSETRELTGGKMKYNHEGIQLLDRNSSRRSPAVYANADTE